MSTIMPSPGAHAPWCDRESHEDYIHFDPLAGCTAPIRVEVVDGRARMSVTLADTAQGPRVLLLDVPGPSDRLTPDGARRLAAALAEVADLAGGHR